MANNTQIVGIDRLLNTLGTLEEAIVEEVNLEFKATAYDINAAAATFIQGAAFDNGELLSRQQVIEHPQKRTYEIVNTAPYAAYVHFGTGRKVEVPDGWEDIANAWRDVKGGTFDDFKARIEEWLTRKGKDKNDAYVLCIAILTNGLEARPFLSTPFFVEAPKLVKRVEKIIKDALNS